MQEHQAPNPEETDPGTLLLAPLAQSLAAPAPQPAALRLRLDARVEAARQAGAGMVNRRQRRLATETLAPGLEAQRLYEAATPTALRPGEPVRALLLHLAPGAHWQAPPAAGLHREWLLLDGQAEVDGQTLQPLDYLFTPPGAAAPLWRSERGARLYLREAPLPGPADAAARLVRDAEAGWPAFAPGVERRVLWQHGDEATLLYRAAAGAQVPHHGHGHDEECLMVRGDLFLDDLLLQQGDYQLAPAGSDHVRTETDVGAVILTHGDSELRFL